MVGTYLRTCFARRQSGLATPLLAWLLNFVELGQCRVHGVTILAPSFMTASHQQFLGSSIVQRLERLVVYVVFLVLSVDCLMSPKGKM